MGGIIASGAVSEGVGRGYVSPLKKAIKDYHDKMLTGLTDDERKEIEAKVAAYRKECEEAGMDAKSIESAVESYYKKLLREYGAKFDPDFIKTLMQAEGGTGTISESEGAAKSAAANTAIKSSIKSEVQTDPDGTVFLIVMSPNGVNMKIKIGMEENSEDELAANIQKAKSNIAAVDYEKNFAAYFEEKSRFSITS